MTTDWAQGIIPKLIEWIKDLFEKTDAQGAVLGISGGIDSAVSCGLLVRALGPERVHGFALPCHSTPTDFDHAKLVASAFGVSLTLCDLTSAYDTLLSAFHGVDGLAAANIRPRLRMTALYAHAQTLGCLVCGNGNRAEWMTGYFTKFGDSGSDFFPLLSFNKAQVRALGRALGVPQVVIDKAPSAGLWDNQTDESELGVSYDCIDAWLEGEPVPEASLHVLERLKARSEHKRSMPPFFAYKA